MLHALTNSQYGWHRDELDMLDSARYLDWGYVAYPPVAAFITRVALTLFGPSLVGVRLFPSLAQAVVMVLAGLMARELGGKRLAQVVAAVAVAIAPVAFLAGALLSYSSFDVLWWVLIAYLMIRLLKSDDPRWWLGIGVVIGLGMMTKYTMAFLVAGIVVGRALHASAPLPDQPVAVGRRRTGAVDLLAEPDLAGAARFHLAGFPAVHPRP